MQIREGDRKWLRLIPHKLHCAQNAGQGTGYGALYAVNPGADTKRGNEAAASASASRLANFGSARTVYF